MSNPSNNQEDFGDESEEDIEYGIRQARRDTSYEYRSTSSLNPAQIMEREVFSQLSVELLDLSLYIMHAIIVLMTIHRRVEMMLTGFNQLLDYSINHLQQLLIKVKNCIDRLLFLFEWVKACGELSLLYVEDLSIFIRRRRRFEPPRFRALDEISQDDCDSWFGLSPYQLNKLFIFWRIPERFTAESRHTFTGEECFIITLYYMIKGTPFTSMARHTFGGDPRTFSKMTKMIIEHLYFTFYHKISGASIEQWIPRYLHRCRYLIHEALSDGALWETTVINGEIVNEEWIVHHFDFDSFRIFGFIDDFAMETSRPGDTVSRNIDLDIQRAFYSGYLRSHGLKAQVVYLPIGLIASVFIAELRQNDNGVLNMSGLNDYLVSVLNGTQRQGQLYPCLYGDGIFRTLSTIIPRFRNPTPPLHLLNVRLASLRESIEHIFSDHSIRFRIFSVPRQLQLMTQGVKVRRMFLVSFFIQNCYSCLNGARCRFFGQIPPSLEEYIPLEESLEPPPAVNLGNVYEFLYGHTENRNNIF